MGDSIEAEVRLLVWQISERAAQGGGMDRLTYDTLFAASAALSSKLATGESQGHEDALHAIRARLHTCGAEPYAKAA
jgi:hypothetical protein